MSRETPVVLDFPTGDFVSGRGRHNARGKPKTYIFGVDHRRVISSLITEFGRILRHFREFQIKLLRQPFRRQVIGQFDGLGLDIQGFGPDVVEFIQCQPRPICDQVLARRRCQKSLCERSTVFFGGNVRELDICLELGGDDIRPGFILSRTSVHHVKQGKPEKERLPLPFSAPATAK